MKNEGDIEGRREYAIRRDKGDKERVKDKKGRET